jgi:cytochrome c oxidase subunit 4
MNEPATAVHPHKGPEDAHEIEHAETHAVSMKVLIAVFVALLILTGLTYVAWAANTGIYVAMFIAALKAALVALFFMHLWWDSLFNGLVLVMALAFVALFISLSMIDTAIYHPDIEDARQDNAAIENVP